MSIDRKGPPPEPDDEPPYETSLRDMFAALVLPAVYSGWLQAAPVSAETVAQGAWRLADAMMATRETVEPPDADPS